MLHDICPKMPEFYMKIARKIFLPESGEGARAPLPPPSPTRMLTANYWEVLIKIKNAILNRPRLSVSHDPFIVAIMHYIRDLRIGRWRSNRIFESNLFNYQRILITKISNYKWSKRDVWNYVFLITILKHIKLPCMITHRATESVYCAATKRR